ncbi:hypothetical protein GJAV_G00081460 [Gymnothorax javanicus]|nr:hypothetical protein GJAV_G00081460 [Gymnothorax javanicus]
MMDKKNANGVASKAPESGSQRKQLPYSVETPYGFHLDLDFLKYVDDIEKGNTIKKVHIQRRNKGSKFSTLPRNFSLPGHASRATPKDSWATTSTLGPKPKSRVMEVQQIFEFRACESGSLGQPRVPGVIHKSTREDSSTREFNEQPLGIHVRPNLMRASSMPVTVLQMKTPESLRDKGAEVAGDSCTENGSSENAFISSDVGDRRSHTQDQAALHQQFAVALQRIKELEQQVRTIPDLQAEIRSLQEEKEQLILQLNSQTSLITEDSIRKAGNHRAEDHEQMPANPDETVVADTAPSSEEQVVPSSFQELDQKSTAEPQESEVQDRPLENQSVEQAEPSESTITQEPAEQELAQIPSTQGLDKEEVNKNSSVEEPKVQDMGESLMKQELVKDDVTAEGSSVQEPAGQELADSSTMQEFLTQDQVVLVSSLEEPVEEKPSQIFITQEVEVQDVVVERRKAAEPVDQELAASPTTIESVKQDDEAESSSAPEFAEQAITELTTEPESERREAAETSLTVVPVRQNEPLENSTSEDSAELKMLESPTAQELQKPHEVLLSSPTEEQETTEAPAVQESAEQEATEHLEVQEAAKQGKAEESSSMLEDAEQETVTDPVPQKLMVEDEVLDSASVVESVLREQTAGNLLGQESTAVVVIMEGDSGQEKEVTEGDQLSIVSEDLTIKALQEKLMALEEKFSEASKELEKTNVLLREQIEVNKLKEERIKLLTEEAEAEKAKLEQETSDLGDSVVSSDRAATCDASVSTDLAPQLLSKGVSTDGAPLLSDTLPITEEHQKNLISTSTQTDLTGAQVSAVTFTAEKLGEAELAGNAQVAVSAPQEQPCSSIEMEPEKAVEVESAEQPEGPESSHSAASDSDEKAGSSPKDSQPSQSSQKQEPSPQGSSEPATSNAAIGQYVNRIQGLLNEQWASLGSGHPEVAPTVKQPTSRFSSIQTQLVSSLSALSAFYSPGQKGGATRQAELKSIMKKNDSTDKSGNGGTKKNLKFVGVNGGYESTSSEESSEEDDAEDSSEPEEKEEAAAVPELVTSEEPPCEEAQAAGSDCDNTAPETSEGVLEEQAGGETVDEGFMKACHFIKDRQAEISAPDKEMREALTVLYQEWFRVSSQKDSQVDTVTLYLKEVGAATPTLLRFLVNLADGNGNTALHYSVSHSNFPIVKLLLDTSLCEVDVQNKAGYTAIMLASLTTAEGPEEMEVAQQLLQQGNVNARASQLSSPFTFSLAGQTALMLAVSHGRTAMVRLLLACGAEVNMQDHDGSTALMCACEHGHAEIARLLLEKPDCDLSLKDREGHSAHEVAEQASHSELVELLKAHASQGPSDTSDTL